MGLFDKIKKFFQSEEPEIQEEKKEVNIKDIGNFLNNEKSEVEKSLQEKKERLKQELFIILDKLEENLRILLEVDISKKKGDERLKQINEIGVRDYSNTLDIFIRKLRDKEFDVINIDKEMEKFIKSSGKSYAKATLLIGKEIENISYDISNLKKLGEDFIKENSDLIKKQENIISLLKKYDKKTENEEKKSEILEEIEKIEKISETEKNNLIDIDKKLNNLKESSDYKQKEELIISKNKKEEDLKIIESKVRLLLDRRIFEKYIYLEDDTSNKIVAKEYIDDPVKKLKLDEDLQILDILKDIKNKIEQGLLDVKDPDKVMKKIDIPKEVLFEYRSNILRLNEEIKKIEEKINYLLSNLSNLDEILKEKLKIENKIEDNKNDIINLTKRLDKMEEIISNLNSEIMSKI